jgi:hypothetical protein
MRTLRSECALRMRIRYSVGTARGISTATIALLPDGPWTTAPLVAATFSATFSDLASSVVFQRACTEDVRVSHVGHAELFFELTQEHTICNIFSELDLVWGRVHGEVHPAVEHVVRWW